ncbi:MAG: Tm-1-like ATP-binding domain-containing protein [Deltaproteobacteria bacterium]|nr:Tm-1-like ATP-binding domain-containing protein [Deltaproteobacteria bacterium]
METKSRVLIVSTMDTKSEEASFLKECLEGEDIKVQILDAGIMGNSPFPVDISRDSVAAAAGSSLADVQNMGHEGKALDVMISGAIKCAGDLYENGEIQGVIGIGGSMGTSLGTAVMRIFPVGFPKVMISTMASRNTRPFVGTKDIMMLHSVCDLSGLNRITRKVLREGALAIAGMANGGEITSPDDRPLAVVSTLGTTESCLVSVRQALEARGMEVVTFHTVGSGGEAMDEVIREEDVELVVDLSLHELVDHSLGGDYDAGPNRGLAALEKGIPTILVPGNMDFLVTGPLALAKERFPGRRMHAHNAAITAVGTNQREMEDLARLHGRFFGI